MSQSKSTDSVRPSVTCGPRHSALGCVLFSLLAACPSSSSGETVQLATPSAPPPEPPAIPAAVRAAVVGDKVHLRWQDTADETGYSIQRRDVSPPALEFVEVGTTPADVTTYEDDRVSPPSTPGLQWRQQFPQTSPPARDAHGMSYDSASNEIVVFGGFTTVGPQQQLSDTWHWNGSDWYSVTTSTSPSARAAFGMCEDVVGGVLFFGGDQSSRYQSDTWRYANGNWQELTPVTSPPARRRMQMVSTGSSVFLFGGFDGRGLGDTWEWDGVNWTQLTPANSPEARWVHMMAYDSDRDRVVLFGGASNTVSALADTWEWTGSDWVKLDPAVSPQPRVQGAMAYDPARKRTVLYSGFPGSVNPVFTDTWEWDGQNWSLLSTHDTPEGRRESQIVFDPVREEVVLFGGNRSYPVSVSFADTWILAVQDVIDYLPFEYRVVAFNPAGDSRPSRAVAAPAPFSLVAVDGGLSVTNLRRIDPDKPGSPEVIKSWRPADFGSTVATSRTHAYVFDRTTDEILTVSLLDGAIVRRVTLDQDQSLLSGGFSMSPEGVLYGVLYGALRRQELRTVDPWTGGTSLIAPLVDGGTGLGFVRDIAFAPNGALYAVGDSPNVPRSYSQTFYTLDSSSGALTEVGPVAVRNLDSLTFAPDGFLYGADSEAGHSTDLYRIDPATGLAEVVGDTGIWSLNGLAVTLVPRTGALFKPTPTVLQTLPDPVGVIVGELNGGGPDVMVLQEGDDAVSVFHGDGAGGFASRHDIATGDLDAPTGLASGELDDRLALDGVVASSGNEVHVFLGGVFDGEYGIVSVESIAVGEGTQGAAVGDFDGDGDGDFAVTAPMSGDVAVFLSTPSGTTPGFARAGSTTVGGMPYGIATGALDADAYDDIVVTNRSGHNVTVLLSDGAGGVAESVFLPVGSNPESVEIVDLDGDGDMDILVGDRGSGTASVILGNGDGSFAEAEGFSVGAFPAAIAVADVDDDGHLDIVAANHRANTLTVLLGNGFGAFSAGGVFPVGSNPSALATGDLNRDGSTDVVVVNSGDDTISILWGN